MRPTLAHSPARLGMPAPRPRSREPAAGASIGCSDSSDPDAAAGETTPLGQAALGSGSAICAGWREHLTFVTPETVVRWHRQAWRLLWRWKSRSRGGRPLLSPEERELIM